MVLCFLSMRLGMATLFCCNTGSITGKVGVSRDLHVDVGDGSWNTLFPDMVAPCASLR